MQLLFLLPILAAAQCATAYVISDAQPAPPANHGAQHSSSLIPVGPPADVHVKFEAQQGSDRYGIPSPPHMQRQQPRPNEVKVPAPDFFVVDFQQAYVEKKTGNGQKIMVIFNVAVKGFWYHCMQEVAGDGGSVDAVCYAEVASLGTVTVTVSEVCTGGFKAVVKGLPIDKSVHVEYKCQSLMDETSKMSMICLCPDCHEKTPMVYMPETPTNGIAAPMN